MKLFDKVSFECSEKFAQSVDWTKIVVPSEVIRSLKDNNSFLTNSFESDMMTYLISLEGNLKSQHFEEYEYLNSNDVPIKMAIKKRGEYWMDENFNGEIVISSDQCIDFLDQDWSLDFKLIFESGFLVSTACINCESVDNVERKQDQKELVGKTIKEASFKAKLIKVYLKFWLKPIDLYLNKFAYKYPSWIPFLKVVRCIIIPFYNYF